MFPRRPSRRVVLGGALATLAAAISGCTSGGALSKAAAAASRTSTPTARPASPTNPTTAPPQAWAIEVGGAESELIALYTAVIKAHPSLGKSLTPLQAAHVSHLAAVKVPATGKAPGGLPPGQAAALAHLGVAEQKAADLAGANALTCPPQAASLLGSIAGSDASNVVALASIGTA